MDASRKESKDVCSIIEIWKGNSDLLWKELSRAIVRTDCEDCIDDTSSPHFSHQTRKTNKLSVTNLRALILDQLNEIQCLSPIENLFQMFVDEMSRFTHLSLLKTEFSDLHALYSHIEYASNIFVSFVNSTRYWRGRFMTVDVFMGSYICTAI